MDHDSVSTPRRALIIIPGTVNYFYNLSGRRIAESLRDLGYTVDVETLTGCRDEGYDWCLVSNITEVLSAYGDKEEGINRISSIVTKSRASASLSIDCVSTIWYQHIRELSARAGIKLILDLGLYDQKAYLNPEDRENYHFAFSGLTASEQATLSSLKDDGTDRTIPWAFVGHSTPYRAALVDHLVQFVDPGGFIYTPAAAPYTEQGSPHLNQQQFERVLGRTRYQIWCSHHSYFYMEPERFRSSLLTGGVPVKIVHTRKEIPKEAPLTYLMMESSDVGSRLNESVFPRLRRRFQSDWSRFPTLRQEIARVLNESEQSAEPYSSQAA